MNSDYESEELHSLEESSSDDDIGDDSGDGSENELKTPMEKGRGQKRTFPVFKPVAKAEHIKFEKDMLFITAKQFKEAITDYAVHGGWGIKFAKNDLQRVRAICQESCKFVAYLTKVPREKSYQLRTLNLEHTCTRSYKNPRCTSSYIGKKLMKKEKPGAREKAREYVDGLTHKKDNRLWEYCEELRRASLAYHTMKVHTFNEGDLAAEMDLVCGFLILRAVHMPRRLQERFMADAANNWFGYIGQNRRWTFILDQQKGLVCGPSLIIGHNMSIESADTSTIISEEPSRYSHRDFFWKAKATYKAEFDRLMDELKGIGEDAHNWLLDHSTTIWAKHMFSEDRLSDTVLNNMCESFNSRILKFRSKPIITMV
ncbi:uncharacterized protein LOC142606269 [Castanea sativa]|uniref:uncharacterized protein LOC142606269 n=1 Tax=Castanea sativa TaxID=21020 RepID=UPI003F652440